MMLQLDPALPVETPKGKALAHVLIDYGIEADLLWVCAQTEGGQCWTWSNQDIRFQDNITAGRVSPGQRDGKHRFHNGLNNFGPASVE